MLVEDDRTLILKPIEGQKARNSAGMVDSRLFTGDNKIHAYKDPWGTWFLKYERGDVPPAFKQKFTGFNQLYDFVTDYYKKRGVEVAGVVYNDATS